MNNPIKSITKLASNTGQQLRDAAQGAAKYALKRAESFVVDEPPIDEPPADSTKPEEEAQKPSTETRPEPEKSESPNAKEEPQDEPQEDTLDAAFEHARESFENGRDRNPEEISEGVFDSLKDELKTAENELEDEFEDEHQHEDEDEHQFEDEDQHQHEDEFEHQNEQPIRQFRAVFTEDDGRHEDTRYLTLSPRARNGKPAVSEPDVFLDVPHLSVDKISLEVENLRARVSLHAEVSNLVSIDVGANVEIEEVELEIEGVEAQALLKVRLDEVHGILDRALKTVDNNPEILTKALPIIRENTKDLASAAGHTVDSASHVVDKGAKKITRKPKNIVGDLADKGAKTITQKPKKVVEDLADKAKSWVGSTSDDDSGPSIEASSHTRYEDS